MLDWTLLTAAALALVPLDAVPAPASAAYQDDQPGLVIHAGETWIFRIKDGQPADPRKATDKDEPAKGEILATLEPGPTGTMLNITSNADTMLNYRAFIVVKPGHKGNRTSVCALLGGGRSNFEQWQEPIPALRLADFTPADGRMGCE